MNDSEMSDQEESDDLKSRCSLVCGSGITAVLLFAGTPFIPALLPLAAGAMATLYIKTRKRLASKNTEEEDDNDSIGSYPMKWEHPSLMKTYDDLMPTSRTDNTWNVAPLGRVDNSRHITVNVTNNIHIEHLHTDGASERRILRSLKTLLKDDSNES